MTQAVLLTLPGATDGTTQWRAEALQMVNWGGFHGHVTVPFAPGATLLSGASGTGKSTLLDAYLAVMMPSDTPFNGASNEATVGRARGANQRNLLTYLRGKTDTNRESSTDELRDQVLRGADTATWGAVAMTFVDDNGKRFTAARIYVVPRGATGTGEVTTKLATVEARVDLRELEPLRGTGFDKRTMENRWPAMTVHGTYASFSQKLFDRLGIGANGDGIKALRLLARIQAGHQIPSVDGLYKSMVLELPATYAAAERAVEHFRDLEDTYREMVTAAEKSRLLSRLPELWGERRDALETEQLIDTFGVARAGSTPFLRWRLCTEARLLEAAVEENRTERREVANNWKAAQGRAGELRLAVEQTKEDQRANGGDRLDRLGAEIDNLNGKRETVQLRRHTFDDRVAPLLLNVSSENDLFTAQLAAETFLAGFDKREEALEEERKAGDAKGYPLTVRREEVVEDLNSLRGRKGLVPRWMHEARLTMAAAAGLDEADLPFVAELVDLAPDQQPWRAAAEVALSSVARVMLVDVRHHEHLSRAIEFKTMRRINFTGVDLVEHTERRGRDGYISGKLIYKASPFSAWVAQRVQSYGTDRLCVNSTDQLAGDDPRITRSGQTRHGRNSAHGRLDTPPIIGFNNADLIASLEAEQGDIDAKIAELAGEVGKIKTRLKALRNEKDAHQHILDTGWVTIDIDGISATIAERRQEVAHILSSSDKLAELAKTLKRMEHDLTKADKETVRTSDRKDTLDEVHGDMCTRQDTVAITLDELDNAGIILTDKQAEYLDLVYARVADAGSLTGLTDGVKRLRGQLAQDSQKERSRAQAATKSLCGIFEQYQQHENWFDPNRGTGIEDYSAYRDELDQLTIDRLHTLREEWRRRLAAWSGQDLLPLHGAFDAAIEDIEDRLRPVNDILAELPFGPQRDRLKIMLRRLNPDDVVNFRRELKLLSSGITDQLTDEQAEARFRRLRKFITLIRKPEAGTRPAVSRDVYLDVRKHVEITAVRLDANGRQVATYAYLGDKSGGETQELVAFIVGAALRFQLGDEDRARPRFAPIFLDEGFIKSDSEFAGRAVGAWKGLGFQLIVGAPLDKVTALEPAMDLLLSITKGPKGYSHLNEIRPTGELAR
jgi:uncharacterized protein YPO0396